MLNISNPNRPRSFQPSLYICILNISNPNRPRSSGRVGSPHISASANITKTPVLFDIGFHLMVYRKHNQNARRLMDITNRPEIERGLL
jgi:hypothetical protein